MIVIDANSLIVLILGQIDPKLISKHKRTSIYNEEDYNDLVAIIGDIEKLVTLTNVWTEVDNLLNNFNKGLKDQYIETLSELVQSVDESYISTISVKDQYYLYDLGVTDSLLLQLAKNCEFLITGDSQLSDYAQAFGIKVYDIVKERRDRI